MTNPQVVEEVPLNIVEVKEMLKKIKDREWDKRKINSHIIPYGNNSNQFTQEDHLHHDRTSIIYFGGLSNNKGSKLIPEIFTRLANNRKQNYTFVCITSSNTESLEKWVMKNKLKKRFTIYNNLDNLTKVEQRLLRGGVAIAPYYPEDKNNFSYFADPGKVKVYLGCGLPIVITAVPPIARTIEKEKAGLIAGYSSVSIAKKIIQITKDANTYKEFQKHATELGKKFDWNMIFGEYLHSYYKK